MYYYACSSSTSVPLQSFGWMKITGLPCAPGLGSVPMMCMLCDLRSSIASYILLTWHHTHNDRLHCSQTHKRRSNLPTWLTNSVIQVNFILKLESAHSTRPLQQYFSWPWIFGWLLLTHSSQISMALKPWSAILTWPWNLTLTFKLDRGSAKLSHYADTHTHTHVPDQLLFLDH